MRVLKYLEVEAHNRAMKKHRGADVFRCNKAGYHRNRMMEETRVIGVIRDQIKVRECTRCHFWMIVRRDKLPRVMRGGWYAGGQE